ncbi:SHOCT domain-containing protein [Roseovarius sp.]|nr:SHOCT domain-containing protein [Roseovarius sp.]
MRDPLEILKERFARGEIDEDEVRRRKQDLQS